MSVLTIVNVAILVFVALYWTDTVITYGEFVQSLT